MAVHTIVGALDVPFALASTRRAVVRRTGALSVPFQIGPTGGFRFAAGLVPAARIATAPADGTPTSIPAWPRKTPDELVDYALDLAPRLSGGDTITSVSWTAAPDGVVIEAARRFGSLAVIWLSGGDVDVPYMLRCTARTAEGRRYEQSVTIAVAADR